MRNCGRGFTAALTESGSPQSRLFCIGRLVDYKRRSAVRLRGKFHPAVGRRLTKPAVLLFSVLMARKMCGFAAHRRLGADCCDRLDIGKLLFVARRHHSRNRVREWVYPGDRAGNQAVNYCLSIETPPTANAATSPFQGRKFCLLSFL